MDEPPASRLFVVCGKSAEEADLLRAFQDYGAVTSVKVIREKGVAYVKFDRASSAAAAIESLHEAVLNEGRGPKIKVMLAESPNTRRGVLGVGAARPPSPQELPLDPDNIPPRSRLFLVVPKNADGALIEEEMNTFPDLQYCKTDLITSKGIVFCKYSKASSALLALEAVNETGMLAGYKVKCLLAEPKGKRGRGDAAALGYDALSPVQQGLRPDFATMQREQLQHAGLAGLSGLQGHLAAAELAGVNSPMNPALAAIGLQDYGSVRNALGALVGLNAGGAGGAGGLLGLHGMSGGAVSSVQTPMPNTPHDMSAATPPQQSYASLAGLNLQLNQAAGLGMGGGGLPGLAGLASMGAGSPPGLSPDGMPLELSRQRLFVVVPKSVTEEQVTRLFRMYPGMEYCDLKKDRPTGKSKGFCYVNYSTPEAAAAAVEQLNGVEFPPQSGHRIKVMFAEPLAPRLPVSPQGMATPAEGMATPAGGGGAGGPSDPQSMSPPGYGSVDHHLATSLFQLAADRGLDLGGLGQRQQQHQQQQDEATAAALMAQHQHQQHTAQQQWGENQQQQHAAAVAEMEAAHQAHHEAAVHAHHRAVAQQQQEQHEAAAAAAAAMMREAQAAAASGGGGGVTSPDTPHGGGGGPAPGSGGGGCGPSAMDSEQLLSSVQSGLAHMSMPREQQQQQQHDLLRYSSQGTTPPHMTQQQQHAYERQFESPDSAGTGPSGSGGGGGGTMPPSPDLVEWKHRAESGSMAGPSGGVVDDGGGGGGGGPGPPLQQQQHGPVEDPCVVYTILSRPLPDYALQHVFSSVGSVELVQLYGGDTRYGAVRFSDPEAASAALQQLHGSEVLGERLMVTRTDPVAAARNTKRPRVGE